MSSHNNNTPITLKGPSITCDVYQSELGGPMSIDAVVPERLALRILKMIRAELNRAA